MKIVEKNPIVGPFLQFLGQKENIQKYPALSYTIS